MKSEEEKDTMTCDEVFCMYLREVSKQVNEIYYRQCLRFVLLYRECANECGWLKRRETYNEVGMLEEDSLLANLKTQEERQEELSKQQLGGLMPKDVSLAPVMVDLDNLDLGDLCPKFEIKGGEAKIEAPRKASNVSITQLADQKIVTPTKAAGGKAETGAENLPSSQKTKQSAKKQETGKTDAEKKSPAKSQ